MDDTYSQLLRNYWGYRNFRPLQREIISCAAEGHDVLAILPTGGGKSLTFQIAGLARGGLTLVITPLIALMEDQVAALRQRGIRAMAVHSGYTAAQVTERLDSCIHGHFSFLYLSPERLRTEPFIARLEALDIRLIAVDEAHCISQWGFDFRPSYRQIAILREQLPGVPVLALTASATPPVQQDICQQLLMEHPQVVSGEFSRRNLIYGVRHPRDINAAMLQFIARVKGSGIIYVRSRAGAQEVAKILCASGFNALHYHAGLPAQERLQRQERWRKGDVPIMVTTNAFGMGIDKPDTRYVLHLGIPPSLEEYYQEAGRAGRDGQTAYALLLAEEWDYAFARENLQRRYPPLAVLYRVWRALMAFLTTVTCHEDRYEFDPKLFRQLSNLDPLELRDALGLFQRKGWISLEQVRLPTLWIRVLADRQTLDANRRRHSPRHVLLQTLVGNYPGICQRAVECKQPELASLLPELGHQIPQLLAQLSDRGLIELKGMSPSCTLLLRGASTDFPIPPIDRQELEADYQRERERLEAVIAYAQNSHQCREFQIARYFGVEAPLRCGHCDVCIEGKR